MAGKTICVATGLCAALLAACDGGPKARSILDAAALFEANITALSAVRAAYPGPYEDFSRIPARNPNDETLFDKNFLKLLRQDIPVEFIDFFPIGDGADEVNVVLWRELSGDRMTTTSLVFFGSDLTLDEKHKNMRAFDVCDQQADDWMQENRSAGSVGVFCKLNARWHAYQRVE